MNNLTINDFIISKLEKTEIFSKHFYKKYKNYCNLNFEDFKSLSEYCLVKLANSKNIQKDNTFDSFLFLQINWHIFNTLRKQKYEIKKIKQIFYKIKNKTPFDSTTYYDVFDYTKHLNEKQKIIFLLKHLEQKSNKDIAKYFNVTKGRISQILDNIYTKLLLMYENSNFLFPKQ